MTLALLILPGGITGNPDVAVGAGVTWLMVIGVVVAVRISTMRAVPLPGVRYVRDWLERFSLRELRPFFLSFIALTAFDVIIQGFASRAFGVPISWEALIGRIPLVYFSFLIPTLGNFGTRELTWAALFGEYGERDALIAYAFSINAIFLVLNVILGVLFLSRALELIRAVRRTRREGGTVPKPLIGDPNNP
jgi:hypothetical protein